MSDQIDSPLILWVLRSDTGIPNTGLVDRILRDERVSAYVDKCRNTRTHIAVIVGSEHKRAAVVEVITRSGWTIDDTYTPSEAEQPLQDDYLARISALHTRGYEDVSGPRINELLGEPPERRVIGRRHLP